MYTLTPVGSPLTTSYSEGYAFYDGDLSLHAPLFKLIYDDDLAAKVVAIVY